MLIAFCVQPSATFLHSGGKFPSCSEPHDSSHRGSRALATRLAATRREPLSLKFVLLPRVTPKSEVPCPFLKNRGYCLKETRCDFLHPIKHQPSTQPNIMPPHIPTYHHGPLFEPHMRRDTRSPFCSAVPGLWPLLSPLHS